MSRTDALIEMNNEKRALLSPSNLKEYERVLMYLRCEWRLQSEATEEVLNDLIDHLLEAQSQGVTTEEFFGEDTMQFAKELVDELPREHNRNIMMFLFTITLYPLAMILIFDGISNLITSFFTEQKPMNIGGFVIGFVSSMIAFYLLLGKVLMDIQKETIDIDAKRKNIGKFFVYWLCCCVIFALYMLPLLFLKVGPQVIVPWYISIGLGLIIFLGARVLFKKFS